MSTVEELLEMLGKHGLRVSCQVVDDVVVKIMHKPRNMAQTISLSFLPCSTLARSVWKRSES